MPNRTITTPAATRVARARFSRLVQTREPGDPALIAARAALVERRILDFIDKLVTEGAPPLPLDSRARIAARVLAGSSSETTAA